ncbi:hypothetical protein MNBD_GAMMA17-1544 [hydrothermal vent metagenome]|uniref:Dystroglycan-type cadherin-like domain-containing protein n=1 Tax=hydrothermal vent metagenome TaxID=652676 RepID=A0A3B0ZTI8_9ZZZZ
MAAARMDVAFYNSQVFFKVITMRTFSLILLSLVSIVMLPDTQAAVPTASDNTITINEDSTYTFSEADFGYFDAAADVFTSIQITTLATAGTLRFFGGNVILDQDINVSNLSNLTFKPALDQFEDDDYGSFQFTVNDGVDNSTPPNTITFNVLPVDDPPYLISPPLSAINEDSLYESAPTVGDVELIADGIDPISQLTFSIENQPAWITGFDTNSGQLSGTPENGNVGVHSNIILTVEDTAGLVTPLPAFSITVNNTNDAPTISGTPATSINEDSLYNFIPGAFDVDVGDTKTFSITNKPGWADFNTSNGTLSGTPTNDDTRDYPDISITVTDSSNEASDTLPLFTITVIAINDAPTFTSSPPINIDEDVNYNFTLTATDVDSVVGDLVFSITPGTSLPDWLNFVPSTGVLSSEAGRPHNEDVGTYNNISFTVTDDEDDESKSTSLPSFSITVNNINDDPGGSISIDDGIRKEGELLTVNTTQLTDEDGLGTFRYLWQRNGINGTTNIGINSSYRLVNADIGTSQTISVTVSYTDRRGTDESVSISAGKITGNTPVQGDVTISGQPYIGQILIADTTALSDADGLGTFLYEWRRSGSTSVVGNNSNNYLLTTADINQIITVTVTYTDGADYSESVTSDPITMDLDQDSDGDGMTDRYEIEHGLNPLDDSDRDLDLDGDGATNYQEFVNGTIPTRDDYPPANFDVPAADPSTINSTGLLTAVDLGIATAIDGKDGIISAIPDNSGPFRPGIHTISWTATDAAGNPTIASTTQTVNVIPMVDFAIDQISNEGTTATVSVHLNGPVATLLEIPFTLSGTADSADHNIATDTISITIAAGDVSGSIIPFIITDADAIENDEILIFTMGDLTALDVIAGHKTTHTITITEQNIAPKVSLNMSQNDEPHTSTVVAVTTPPTEPPNVNEVVVTANIVPELTAGMKLDWSKSDNTLVGDEIDLINNTFTFEPGELNVGTYSIVVDVLEITGVNENGEDITNPVASQRHRFKVVVSVPADEDHEDRDDDGIADQYDEIALSRVIALQQADQSRHLVETEPGLQLRLGAIAFESATNGLQVSASTIEIYATNIRRPNDDYFNVGGLFDFEVHGLTTAGDSAQVVIPLRKQIPTDPYYRKLMPTGWQDFIIDDNNALASAPGSNGSCPPPNHSAYSQGLTPGHLCIQLLLEDDGPNDTDGEANGAITHTGGVAVKPIDSEPPPPQEVLPLPATGGGALYSTLLLLLALAYSRSYRCHRGSPQTHT